MDQVQATAWPAETVNALVEAGKYVVNLVLEGNVRDVRYWVLVALVLSVLWGPYALYRIRKRRNGSNT